MKKPYFKLQKSSQIKLLIIFWKNIVYNALIRTKAESIIKEHANELTDRVVVFFADKRNVSVKQHHFRSSSIREISTCVKSC